MKLDNTTRLEYVSLLVKDLENMTDFYTRIIGLKILESKKKQVMLGIGNQRIVELTTHEDVVVANRPYAGLYHLAILVPDEKYLGKVLYHLFDLQYDLTGAGDHLYSQALYLNDPEGNGIEIYADRPRETWTINEDGTIVGGTEAVDVQRLLEISDKTPWDGLPEGTRLGHVHLQVSNISNTREFYVNTLGYEIKTDWETALFVSKNGYHHDFGLNIWNGNIPPRPENTTGLLKVVSSIQSHNGLDTIGKTIENGFELKDTDEIINQYIMM